MRKKHIFLSIAIIIFIISILIISKVFIKKDLKSEKDDSPFFIKKQIYYSGILPKSTSYNDTENWNLSISQYTDIGIYLSTKSEQLTSTNTISSLYIDQIKYTQTPKIGKPSLYYQNPKKFATATISSDYLIENHLNYTILNFDNKENYDYYSTPNFFTDCSLPITLKYVNSDILRNYKVNNSKPLIFNGQILKESNINLSDLESSLTFCINIVSNDNKLYKLKAQINIPLKNGTETLFDKNILTKENDIN